MTIAINPPATRAMLRTLDPEYKRWYNKGWRYSASAAAQGLEHGDGMNAPDAWYDGYLDLGAGREKWHLAFCRGCPEHPPAVA